MKLDKISIDDVIDLAKYLQDDVYAQRNAKFLEDETLYHCDFKHLLGVPDQYKNDALVLSTGRDMVDTFCNHTNISNARVRATKKGADCKKSAEEERMERHFGAGVLYMTNLDSEVSPWWDVNKHFWTYGMGVIKTIYVADLWPNRPSQKKGESDEAYDERLIEWLGETGKRFPIKVMDVHPYNVYPDPDQRSIDFVVEINEYHYMKAKQKYPFWENPENRTGNNPNVKHISFWSANQHMEIVDGQSIIRTKSGIDNHGYGFIPYVIFNTGLGMLTKDNDMSKRYVGMLRYVRDLLIAESSSFSVDHIVLKKAAWPGGFIRGKNAAKQQRLEEHYGVWQVLMDDVEVVEYQHAVPPSESRMHFADIHSLLAEHGAPPTMQGMGETGVRSGSDRRLLMAEGAKRLAHAEDIFKHKTEKVLENCAKLLINRVPGDVRVWARDNISSFDMMIDKKKIKEPINYNVEFSPISLEDEYRRHDDQIRMNSANIWDRTFVWQQQSNVDPDDMEERMERQRLMDDPIISQMISQAAGALTMNALRKKIGSDELLAQMMGQGQGQEGGEGMPQQGASQQLPMGGMTQGVPNIAPPGSAQEMQNRMSRNRSQIPMSATQGQGGGGARGATR